MQYEEFLSRVKEQAKSHDERESLVAIEATLKTLGERLTEIQAVRLAGLLPFEIGLFLTVVDTNKDFNLESFYRHVASREGIPLPESYRHAQAVLTVLDETLAAGELREALADLPDEYQRLIQ